MTLDEAIKHCIENSCNNTECSREHMQLAEWLKELKAIKNTETGIILDGEVYKATQTENCIGCDFNCFGCSNPGGFFLCDIFKNINKFSGGGFKKVNYDEEY